MNRLILAIVTVSMLITGCAGSFTLDESDQIEERTTTYSMLFEGSGKCVIDYSISGKVNAMSVTLPYEYKIGEAKSWYYKATKKTTYGKTPNWSYFMLLSGDKNAQIKYCINGEVVQTEKIIEGDINVAIIRSSK